MKFAALVFLAVAFGLLGAITWRAVATSWAAVCVGLVCLTTVALRFSSTAHPATE